MESQFDSDSQGRQESNILFSVQVIRYFYSTSRDTDIRDVLAIRIQDVVYLLYCTSTSQYGQQRWRATIHVKVIRPVFPNLARCPQFCPNKRAQASNCLVAQPSFPSPSPQGLDPANDRWAIMSQLAYGRKSIFPPVEFTALSIVRGSCSMDILIDRDLTNNPICIQLRSHEAHD